MKTNVTSLEIERALLVKMKGPECDGAAALAIAKELLARLEGPKAVEVTLLHVGQDKGISTDEAP